MKLTLNHSAIVSWKQRLSDTACWSKIGGYKYLYSKDFGRWKLSCRLICPIILGTQGDSLNIIDPQVDVCTLRSGTLVTTASIGNSILLETQRCL